MQTIGCNDGTSKPVTFDDLRRAADALSAYRPPNIAEDAVLCLLGVCFQPKRIECEDWGKHGISV